MFALPELFVPKQFSLSQSYDLLKLILETSFIGVVHPLYAPQFSLIVLLDKRKSTFSLDSKFCPSIMSYL